MVRGQEYVQEICRGGRPLYPNIAKDQVNAAGMTNRSIRHETRIMYRKIVPIFNEPRFAVDQEDMCFR